MGNGELRAKLLVNRSSECSQPIYLVLSVNTTGNPMSDRGKTNDYTQAPVGEMALPDGQWTGPTKD